jgi:hypothetical protein
MCPDRFRSVSVFPNEKEKEVGTHELSLRPPPLEQPTQQDGKSTMYVLGRKVPAGLRESFPHVLPMSEAYAKMRSGHDGASATKERRSMTSEG